jgi:hypothetical protein
MDFSNHELLWRNLKQRLADVPEDRVLTSYALLFPSVVVGDEATFRHA